jgi:translation initiation factor IF-3
LIKKLYRPGFNKFKRQEHRINERIFATTLRVLDNEGKQVGVLSKEEALRLAKEQEVDLVEIAPLAKPPVAKLVDYNKFLYQQEKKKREEKRKAKVSETKEVRLGPFMGQADLGNMMHRAKIFLGEGDKVRLVLKFRGRQIIHPEFGHETLQKMIQGLADVSKVERAPRLEGKQLIAILSPGKANAPKEEGDIHAKEEDQKSSSQTI